MKCKYCNRKIGMIKHLNTTSSERCIWCDGDYHKRKQKEKVAFTGDWSLFIGRWQPLHPGHIKLMRTVLKEGKNVCIGIRDSKVNDNNPYTAKDRIKMIEKEFSKEIKKGTLKHVILPDIQEIVHGRQVGWGVREIKLDSKTESISGTKERKKRKK